MALVEMTISSAKIEDAIKGSGDVLHDVKIMNAEFDEWEDLVVLTLMVDDDDVTSLPDCISVIECCTVDESED